MKYCDNVILQKEIRIFLLLVQSLKEYTDDPIHIINVCIKKNDISTSDQEEEKNILQEFIRSKVKFKNLEILQ